MGLACMALDARRALHAIIPLDRARQREETRSPVGRPVFKTGKGRQRFLVGSTPTLFRHLLPSTLTVVKFRCTIDRSRGRPISGVRTVSSSRQAGYAYLGLLAFITLFGLALSAAAVIWSTATQREREEDLLFVGQEFRTAIARYRERNQARADRLPRELADLLKDDTQVPTQRYLRKLYVDPMTGKRDWKLVRAPSGGILGVYSSSNKAPLRKVRFPAGLADFAEASKYSDWRFIVQDEGADESAPGRRPVGGLRLPESEGGPSSPVQGIPQTQQGQMGSPLQMAPVPVPAPRPHLSPESSLDEPPPEDMEEGVPEPDLPSDDGNDPPLGPGSPDEG
jgi:type II secretory pathway pseudopilin PulG